MRQAGRLPVETTPARTEETGLAGAFPSRTTLPDWEEEDPPFSGNVSFRERALLELLAPRDEGYAFYRSLLGQPRAGLEGSLPEWQVVADGRGVPRWLVAATPLPGIGRAGFMVDAEWARSEILSPLVAAWFDPRHATLTLRRDRQAAEPGVLTRATLLPGWRLELRFRSGQAPERLARQAVRLEAGLVAALTALVLAGLLLVRRQARFETRLAQARGDLVDSLAHTLKTPLTRMRLLAENLQGGWVTDEAKRREYLSAIIVESDRLGGVVEKLLDSAGNEGDLLPGTRTRQPLAPLLRTAAMRGKRPGGEGNLSLEIDETVPPVRIDHEGVLGAISELLENARKYAGGADRLALTRRGRFAVIEVFDRGPGIRWQDRRRLFRKYFRSTDPRHASREGNGLGLYLVAQVARGHGGRVRVSRRPGGGSVFAIHVPLEKTHG